MYSETIAKAIQKNSKFKADHHDINADLLVVEQFFYVFFIINQFLQCPLTMPVLNDCVNESTYHLAVAFSKWSKQTHLEVCKRLFNDEIVFTRLMGEIQSFIDDTLIATNFGINEIGEAE